MINCKHVIIQRVVSLFFPVKFQQTIPNKRNQDYRNYVRNISMTFQETILQGMCRKKSQQRARGSLRMQTYFRLSLVSAENNVCKPEPGNDFCDVGILSQSQFNSSSPRTTARGIRCEEHSSFILS